MDLQVSYQNRRRSERAESYLLDHLNEFEPIRNRVDLAMAELIVDGDGVHTVKLGIKTPKAFRSLVKARHENLYTAMHQAVEKLKRRIKRSLGKMALDSRKPHNVMYGELQEPPELTIDAENVIRFEDALRAKGRLHPVKLIVTNDDIAAFLKELSLRLACMGAAKRDLKHFDKAIKKVERSDESIQDLVLSDSNLEKALRIKRPIAHKIEEFVREGHSTLLEHLREQTPNDIQDIVRVKGIGPVKAKQLYDYCEVNELEELENMAKQGRVKQIPGFGEHIESEIVGNAANH
ncbi:HPF/RaiA family ribosome-associated protein [Pseudobacteriovorax antillogorgiicola]|uniref:Sigma 54 modulation protein / S30EA ribosomal protein n=1 Tax=Pseudobacteriovorax antillogorgiicola TaxID=1513793 RepID=A0A1Y6BV66_9BACT|nr:HPF/RaiA family ribosome-associated protein [Pseudobacteriovorax antillogorgiicola]TCS53745.1 sigma 54 modulation/S30EA-like ribosomal protein [Pseudobacteriovorax antillogorgiicola]SMF22635.1 Sigma 54 modulation protein / S30EA ribosomal protein [Pseudobacteriovorax antillogorgiicola]